MKFTDPKGKVNRALGLAVYENRGAVKALERREYKPGMHGQRRSKVSEFGLAMLEKQKLRPCYGRHEVQLARFFAQAARKGGNAGDELLALCGRRLDNAVRRAGFAGTRPQARQGVCHEHFRVNGRKVDVASYLLKPGDVVSIAPRPNVQRHYREVLTEGLHNADWLGSDAEALAFTMVRLLAAADSGLSVYATKVVELLTR